MFVRVHLCIAVYRKVYMMCVYAFVVCLAGKNWESNCWSGAGFYILLGFSWDWNHACIRVCLMYVPVLSSYACVNCISSCFLWWHPASTFGNCVLFVRLLRKCRKGKGFEIFYYSASLSFWHNNDKSFNWLHLV